MLMRSNNRPPILAGTIGAHPVAAAIGALLMLAGAALSVPFLNAVQTASGSISFSFSGIYGCARVFACDVALLITINFALLRRCLIPLSCAALIIDGSLTGFGFFALLRCDNVFWALLYILPCAIEASAMLIAFITASTGAKGAVITTTRMSFCCLFMLLTATAMQGVLATLMGAHN